jgi:multidrug efflux pump
MVVALYDSTDQATSADVSDYLVSHFQDDLGRVDGVGQTQVFGSQYAMRIWLDPAKLAAVQLMPSDIEAAIEAQNTEVSAGQIGAQPSVPGQMLNAVVTAKSRFTTADQFRAIIVKTATDGSVVRLGDVAAVELGQENYNFSVLTNGHPGSGMAIQLAPGADALKTAIAVRKRVSELSSQLPPGYEIAYPRDSTEFVRLSIQEVVQTLIVAIVLVVLVMYAFLQNWRATLVPAIAVPVVLLGTFGVLSVFHYSINTLTLFGMVLAIGLLVDDAIVVVENVERVMREDRLPPREATIKSMGEIGAALIGIAVVLSAVMLPMAFFGGSTGVIYRQFSITIVSAMLLSIVVALVLSPAICATLLKPHERAPHEGEGRLAQFHRWFERTIGRYIGAVEAVLGARPLHIAVFAAITIAALLLFLRLPTGFLPVEDQGAAMVSYTLPAGATTARTLAVRKQIQDYFEKHEAKDVTNTMLVAGFGFGGQGQNAGTGFISLAPFDQRRGARESVDAINRRATAAFRRILDARVFPTSPPAIRGLGQSNGFTFQLLNAQGLSRAAFVALRDRLVEAASADPKLAQVRASALPDAPQLHVDIDETKLAVLGLSESAVTSTLADAWGGRYVDDFIDRGRVKRVFIQGEASSRMLPSDLNDWYVRSSSGEMAPFSAFANVGWENGPSTLSRFNGQSAYEIQGQAAPGVSSGEAMQEMARLQRQIAPGAGHAWSGLSYEETQSSGQAPLLYAVSILVVFLCLAALYESWSVPLAVLFALPLGVVGAVLAVTVRGLENDIYFQVGLLTTLGLTAKNAILIIEFAEAARRAGRDVIAAALEAARLRLRPIMMTSIAFIAGVLPLVFASGVSARSRIEIGAAVAGGMLTATAFVIFYVPMFFVIVSQMFHPKSAPAPVTEAP